MFSLRTPSATLAGLAVAVLTFLPGMAHAEDWRAARSMPELVEVLEGWLDAHSPWPRRADAPRVRWTNAQSAAAMAGHAARSAALNPRGFYDADIATIYLVEPWSAGDAQDVSVLLHELAHHRQAEAGHWYCPGAQEKPAYKLQAAWLAEQGLTGNINWIAVELASGCTPRDIHPD